MRDDAAGIHPPYRRYSTSPTSPMSHACKRKTVGAKGRDKARRHDVDDDQASNVHPTNKQRKPLTMSLVGFIPPCLLAQ